MRDDRTRTTAAWPWAPRAVLLALGLLVLRLGLGGLMIYGHGWGKVQHFAEKASSFPDPLGIGSAPSLLLAAAAESACALAVAAGLATRLASLPLIVTMTVAAFAVHGRGPWHDQEFALLYLLGFVAVALAGPGRLSLDACLESAMNRPGGEASESF